MKHVSYNLLISLIVFFLFESCIKSSKSENNILSVSIEPQKYFLEKLVGDKYTINIVIPKGANPESYDPSPSQMVNISRSNIYFKIGNLEMENTWLKNINANNPSMNIINCSDNITTIKDNNHHGYDPHIWSSPKTVSVIAKNMYNALILNDAENKEYYLRNYIELEKDIHQTDSIIKQYLNNAPSKAFIIYHPTLSYFADQYSLKQISIESEGKQPTPQHLATLIKLGHKEGVKVVFIQEGFDIKNAEIIAQQLNARIVPINPISENWRSEMISIAKALANNDE